ncbi:hypothetical protein K438DRAFT_1821036 [Mycena galopus ATCC 62051]|nr:hypothetical protein K438DRAFT_1821036 [Mycena galopus ATCC 62051]
MRISTALASLTPSLIPSSSSNFDNSLTWLAVTMPSSKLLTKTFWRSTLKLTKKSSTPTQSDDPTASSVRPITFSAAPHGANPVSLAHLPAGGYTPEGLLAEACPKQHKGFGELVQYGVSTISAGSNGRDFSTKLPNIVPERSGFVRTVITAYNQHHALVIRPDDVWLAILCQFNFFVNANAELLRASFVAHEGKRELIIEEEGSRFDIDFGRMARHMVDLLEQNVVDPTLREWAMPAFSTTTENDTTVSAVLMMATLKQYFAYTFDCTCCGIPRVTIEGEKADWENILGRLEKLKEYGLETIAWYHLLRPVISRFVAAFDDPNSAENIDFWKRVAHFESMGSGPDYYTGWINAFNVFSEKGNWLGTQLNKEALSELAPEKLSAEEFWAKYVKYKGYQELVLDGTPYHQVDTAQVPVGYTAVDIKLIDNDEVFESEMVAGMVGMQVSSSHDVTLSETGIDDVVRPVSGWWLYIKK